MPIGGGLSASSPPKLLGVGGEPRARVDDADAWQTKRSWESGRALIWEGLTGEPIVA